MKTLAILYGLFEGPAIGKAFNDESERRGLTVIDDASKADVIIAHSGGWLFLPPNNSATRIVLIDVSHKSHRSIVRKFAGRMAYDFRHVVPTHLFFVWLTLRVLNIWYFVTQFPIWLEMGRRYETQDILALVSQPNVTVIYSDDRSWIDADTIAHAHDYVQLDVGSHDNCWINPSVYLDILNDEN